MHGVRLFEKAVQMLLAARRCQIDGFVRLNVGDVGLLLQAAALAVEWMGDLIHFRLADEE